MAISHDSRQLIVAGGGHLEVFDFSSGKRLGGDSQLGASYSRVQAFQDQPMIAVAEGENGIALRELPTCRVRHRLLADRKGVAHIAKSANGCNLASVGADQVLRIWDTRSWDSLLLLDARIRNGHPDELYFSRDGRRLFGFHDREIVVWEAR